LYAYVDNGTEPAASGITPHDSDDGTTTTADEPWLNDLAKDAAKNCGHSRGGRRTLYV
jgi:hypothetical protein